MVLFSNIQIANFAAQSNIILTWIDNDIFSTVDGCPNACETWKAIERLKQGESINMMNELVKNQCDVTNHQVNVKFLLQLQPEWKRFVMLVKHSQELKTVSYHKLYDILKQHQNKVNKIRAERLAHTANPLALVAQQQPAYHPHNHPTHYTNNSSTRSQQAATRNRGKAIVNSPPPTYNQEPKMVAEDDTLSKEKEIDKFMALISLSFKKSTNLPTTTLELHQTPVEQIKIILQGLIKELVKECQKPKQEKDAAYHKEKMLLCKQEEAGFHEHPKQPESVNDTYPVEQDEHNIIIDSLDISYDREQDDQDDNDDLAKERDLLASLIARLKCEIDDSKNRKKKLETSNKALVDKLKDLKKFQVELDRYHDVNYASKVAIDCAKAKGDLMSYIMKFEKSFNEYTQKINDLNQTISEIKKELVAHQETISIMSQKREAQRKFHKTRDDKEIEKVIAFEKKVKVLDDIVYKTGQSFQTMNILNRNCKTSFVKPEYLKKAQRANPCLYDKGCCTDNLALMLAPESDETIRFSQESQSKLIIKCERIEKELSKSNTTSKSFEVLQQHAINLELALQQNLKAQLQDIDIAIIELKKLIEKMKGKYVETKFEKSSVIRQPNAFKSQRQLVFGKPTTFLDSLAKTHFLKSKSVTINNVSNDFSNPVTAQILPQNVKSILKNTNVIAPGMYKVHTKPNQTRIPQFPQDIWKTNKRVSFSTGVISTTSVSRPQLKSNRLEDRVMHNNSKGKKQQVEDHHMIFKFSNNKTSITACNDSLNAKTSDVNFLCVTCGKCMINDNHDMCVLHYSINSRTKMPMAVPISTREPKRTVNQFVATPLKRTVASESTNQKPRSKIRKQYEQISKTSRRDYSIHRRLSVLKAHDGKSQAS
ncbi:hypothetical protein Tco_1147921, partial [Tanacetum coccineum]